MTKHTPGPWRIGKTSGWSGTEVKAIASVAWCAKASSYSSSWGESQEISADEALANAHLIAAAPDLLAACEACMTLLVRYENKSIAPEVGTGAAINAAHAAIAKARGQG